MRLQEEALDQPPDSPEGRRDLMWMEEIQELQDADIKPTMPSNTPNVTVTKGTKPRRKPFYPKL